MARDWLMILLGLGIGFFAFTTVGKRAALAGMGVGKKEAEKLVEKLEKKEKE